ncbi:MAG: BBE domain-containing protein [Casimicrobiaceae bacterium]
MLRCPGSRVAESDFFEQDWQRAHWGPTYPRLEPMKWVKWKSDPDELFYVHHGVGSEEWSADGSAWFDPGFGRRATFHVKPPHDRYGPAGRGST